MINVRFANESDAKKIYEFVCQLEEIQFDYNKFETIFLRCLRNSENFYLVAVTANDEAVGYLSCHGQTLLHHLAKVFEIQELFVSEKYRNQEIGKQLIDAIENILRERKEQFIEVTSNTKRKDTHRFYINNGYKQSHLKFTKEI